MSSLPVEAPSGIGTEIVPGTSCYVLHMIRCADSTSGMTSNADTYGLLHALAVLKKRSRHIKDMHQSEGPVMLAQSESLAAVPHHVGRSAEAGHEFTWPGEHLYACATQCARIHP